MERGIDHLVLCARDLDRARQAYERLGFCLTPRAFHPWGTANHLVQLTGCFLELLAVAEPAQIAPHAPGHFSFGAFNRDYLAARDGFSMLAFESHDARADQAAFARDGLCTYAPFDFQRSARLPDGSAANVAFSLVFVTDPRMPAAAMFTCQQHTPQYFWKPDYQQHENGALEVAEVVMVAPTPVELTDLYSKIQSPAAVTVTDGALQVRTARGQIAVLSPAQLAARLSPGRVAGAEAANRAQYAPQQCDTPQFAAYRVTVADLSRCTALLAQRGIQFARRDDTVLVGPEDAVGVFIEFAQAPRDAPG